jgi:hypothetical protein
MRIVAGVVVVTALVAEPALAQSATPRPAVTMWAGKTTTSGDEGPGVGLSAEWPIDPMGRIRVETGRAFWTGGDQRWLSGSMIVKPTRAQIGYLGVGYGVYGDLATARETRSRTGGMHLLAGFDVDADRFGIAAEVTLRLPKGLSRSGPQGALAGPPAGHQPRASAGLAIGIRRRF